MIHHCNVVFTPRRVTVIPTVPAAPPPKSLPRVVAFALGVLALLGAAGALKAQPPAAAPRADSAPAAPARAINWTSDRRSFAVGDIIKVKVDEYAKAAASKDNTSSASRRREMNLGVQPPALPGGASPLGNVDATIETGDGGESRQRGNASRDTRYVGELAVRVIAISPDGLLQVSGTKTIDVDKNKAVLTLTGFVRPIDIGARDIIYSGVIADAQISYSAKGGLGNPKNGIVGKLLGLFWP